VNPVKPVKVKKDITVATLIKQYEHCAFGAGRLAKAVKIYKEMQAEDVTSFFGLAGAMIPAGMRQVVGDMIKRRDIDVLVTTGANLVHDMIEAFGGEHCKGQCSVDDIELKNSKIDRIYDVYLADKHFTIFDKSWIYATKRNDPERFS